MTSRSSEDDNGFSLFGRDLFGEQKTQKAKGVVAERFVVSPFTVLEARAGSWQERKRAWKRLGIESEVGRGENLTFNGSTISLGELDTSIFDPVLCELVYRWFSAPGAVVLDPFAGGSVRGVVASCLGRSYYGIELREEQVKANVAQADEICANDKPAYVCGDSADKLQHAPQADLLFTCPPYGNLEVYSDDPADLSNMPWGEFEKSYRRIIRRAARRLKRERFACFVVANFRNSDGFYHDFVGATIRAFGDVGMPLYNDAVLVQAVGSGSMRVSRQFNAGRKMVKMHQNVLVFCKGDPAWAADWASNGDKED